MGSGPFSRFPEVGQFKLENAIEAPPASICIPYLIVDQKKVAAGQVAIAEQEIGPAHLAFAIPLDDAPDEEIGRKGVEEAVAEAPGQQLSCRQLYAVEFAVGIDSQLATELPCDLAAETIFATIEKIAAFIGDPSRKRAPPIGEQDQTIASKVPLIPCTCAPASRLT